MKLGIAASGVHFVDGMANAMEHQEADFTDVMILMCILNRQYTVSLDEYESSVNGLYVADKDALVNWQKLFFKMMIHLLRKFWIHPPYVMN